MNRDVLEGKWKQLRGEVQRQWGKLTDDELDQVRGDAVKLLGLLQERYGYSKEEAEKRLHSLVESFQPEPAATAAGRG